MLIYYDQASEHMQRVLWGNPEEHRASCFALQEINNQMSFIFQTRNTGLIKIINWKRAGQQLALAVRDYLFYNSTAVSWFNTHQVLANDRVAL